MTTVKDSSLRTQAVNPKKGWKLSGKGSLGVRDSESETHHQPKESETPESETRFEPEVRRSPKESVTPESATRDQPRSQSLLPNEPETHRSSNPPDTVGNAERPKSRVFWRLHAQRGLLRQRSFFQPTGLRDPRKS